MNIVKNTQKAFTLVEMIVVLAIIAILSSIFFYSGFDSTRIHSTVISDSDNISIFATDMQNMTTSFVKNNTADNVGYGMYLDLNNTSKLESFFKYIGDDFYSTDLPNITNKPTDDLLLTGSNRISKICLNGCNNFIATNNLKLAIYFIKPKPHAYFSVSQDGINFSQNINSQAIEKACIEISPSGNDYIRHVDIYYIGQVSSSYGGCQ